MTVTMQDVFRHRRMCTKKKWYAREFDAKCAAAKHKKARMRAYDCPYCEGWHLTSKRKRTSGTRIEIRRASGVCSSEGRCSLSDRVSKSDEQSKEAVR